MKLLRRMIALLLSLLAAAVLLTAVSCGSGGKNADSADSSDDAGTKLTGRELLFTFRLRIDGEEYSLPARFGDFAANGWALAGENQSVGSNTWLANIAIVRDGETLIIQPFNPTSSPLNITDCAVVDIQAKIGDVNSLELPGGLRFDSEIRPGNITSTYGVPDSQDRSAESDRYFYRYEQDDYTYAEFTLYGGNGGVDKRYSSVELKKIYR